MIFSVELTVRREKSISDSTCIKAGARVKRNGRAEEREGRKKKGRLKGPHQMLALSVLFE